MSKKSEPSILPPLNMSEVQLGIHKGDVGRIERHLEKLKKEHGEERVTESLNSGGGDLTIMHMLCAHKETSGRRDVASLLLENGARVDVAGGHDKKTPVDIAVREGNLGYLRIMAEHEKVPKYMVRHIKQELRQIGKESHTRRTYRHK